MRNFKRVLAILLAIMMVIPMTVISASAEDEATVGNWVLFGGKYAAGTGYYMANKGAIGFTMTENADGGIDVHVPDKTEFGNNTANCPISYVFCDTPTPLDNLSVTMKVNDEFNFSGVYSNRVACAWTVDRPITVEDIVELTKGVNSSIKNIFEDNRPALVHRDDCVATNGLRALVCDTRTLGKGVLVQLSSTSNGLPYTEEFAGKVAGNVSISLYDGEYVDCNDGYGYRWCFVAQNYGPHTPNGRGDGIYSFNEAVDISQGVTFEFIPDTTLGYIITINGKEFCHGEEIGAFPNDTGDLKYDVDIEQKSEKYLTSMTYLKEDIDMTALVGEGDGYMLCGTTGRIETDPKTDYTVVSVNGVPAAQWNGEANTHTHTWENDNDHSVFATCTERGHTYYKCACGAVKHPQIKSVFPASPEAMQAQAMEELLKLNYKRVMWEDTFPGNNQGRDSWYRENMYEILNRCYIEMYSDPDFEDHIIGHEWEVVSYTPASCSRDGVINYACARCNERKAETLPTLGHNWGNWEYANDNTAKRRFCSECGVDETVYIAESGNPSDYWTGWSKNLLSRLANAGADIDLVDAPDDNTFELVNNGGDLEVNDSRADVRVKHEFIIPSEIEGEPDIIDEQWEHTSMVVSPVTRVMSKYANVLDGFTATVNPVKAPGFEGVYNSALSFIWTTVPENYDGYREYSTETFQDNYGWARFGYLWDSYVPNQEYTFVLTVLDQLFLDKNYDGTISGSGEIQIGTRDDKVYDAVYYTAIKAGEVAASGYTAVTIPMEDGVSIALAYTANGISYTINGDTYTAQNTAGTQLLIDTYYFGIASNALNNRGSSSFVVTDVCGQDAATYTGGVPGGVPAHTHSYTESITTDATCTTAGVKTFTCACGDSYTEEIAALGHDFGDWLIVAEATATTDGLKKRECTRCDAFETEVIPATGDYDTAADVYITNYVITFKNAADLNAIRIAKGAGLNTSQIKNAPGCINISKAVITAGTDAGGNYNYELPDGGEWSVWYKLNDGTQIVVNQGLKNTEMVQEVTTYGVTMTVHNLYGVKDFFVARGVYSTYREVKNAAGSFSVTSAKIAGAHNYKYGAAVGEPGTYTICVRYDDGRPDYVFTFETEVIYPVVTTFGKDITVSNIDDIRVIRVAAGTYTTVNAVKNATGCRNFTASTIKKLGFTDDYLTVNNAVDEQGADTKYTITVEYRNLYTEVHQITLNKLMPEYIISNGNITFHNLEGLTLVRYAPGSYSTATGIKNAPGSQYLKSAEDDTISLNISGQYSFLVQYSEGSMNIFTANIPN